MMTLHTSTMRQSALLPPARAVGRPRNEQTRRLILQSALRLLEDVSLQALTIEAIARAAGVSKATIYRWWNSKALLVLDAFIEHHIIKTPMDHEVPPGEAIFAHMRLLAAQYAQLPGRIVAQIVAEAQNDPSIGREFRERFHYGRRAVVREKLQEWRASGGLRTDVDIEILMDLLYAPLYMRLLIAHGPIDEAFVDNLIMSARRLIEIDSDHSF